MSAKRLTTSIVFCLTLGLCATTAFGLEPATAVDAWKGMQNWTFGSPTTIPSEGIVIRRDVGTFTLQSGTVRLMAPVDGSVHGLLFEGTGTLRIEVPDANELYQLRRFVGDPELMVMESSFTKLYIRSSDDLAARTGLAFTGPAEPNNDAKKRQEQWLVEEWLDVDARIVAAALSQDAAWERIEADTSKWSWLAFTYDEFADEEITVTRFDEGFTESWLSMQRDRKSVV